MNSNNSISIKTDAQSAKRPTLAPAGWAPRFPKRRPFEVVPFAELTDQVNAHLITAVLPAEGLAVLYGDIIPDVRHAVIDIAVGLNAPVVKNWHGHWRSLSRVVIVTGYHIPTLQQDITVHAMREGINPGDLTIGIVGDAPNFLHGEHTALAEEIEAIGGADLIVIFDVSHVMGDCTSSNADNVLGVAEAAYELQQITGALVLLVHGINAPKARWKSRDRQFDGNKITLLEVGRFDRETLEPRGFTCDSADPIGLHVRQLVAPWPPTDVDEPHTVLLT